jgi:hypothetical protein
LRTDPRRDKFHHPAPGAPYQTTSPTGALPLIEDPMPTNTARVLAVDLAVGAMQPAIPLSPRAVSTIDKLHL